MAKVGVIESYKLKRAVVSSASEAAEVRQSQVSNVCCGVLILASSYSGLTQ